MRLIGSAILLCLLCFFVANGQIVVAADGSGDFETVQQAVDHVPDNNNQPVVIRIKRGVYQEQVRVNKRYITFRGEDPANTVLTYRLSALQAGNTRLAFSTLIKANDFHAAAIAPALRCRVGLPGLGSIQHDIDANGIEWKDDQTVCGFLQNTSL